MLPRFCKLCYHTFDESIVNLRRYSRKHSRKNASIYRDLTVEIPDSKDLRSELNDENDLPIKKQKDRHCIIKCKRTSFNMYEGDVYPKFEPIPLASRSWDHRKAKGDYFTIFPPKEIASQQMLTDVPYTDINLNSTLIQNLKNNGITHPTLIQQTAIPKILSGQNVVMTAEPGCGKTYAFLIPLLQQILLWKCDHERNVNQPLGVILTPSRELCQQISKVAKLLAKDLEIEISTLLGGSSKAQFLNPPVKYVDLVISTLGTLHKLVGYNVFKMNEVRHVVIDEADTMFDNTFNEKIIRMLKAIPIGATRNNDTDYPETAQLTLNSATIPQNLPEILNGVVDSNSLLPVTTGSENQIRVPQKFLRLGGGQKPEMLLQLVKSKIKSKIPVVIFSNSSNVCDFTSLFLKNCNIKTVNLHGNMPLQYRRGKFTEFQNGLCNILTTTDAGSRGLDTTMVKDVINFEFPLVTSDYIHRCGRIGRIGSPKDCKVINFISKPLEIVLTKKIEFAVRKRKPIPLVNLIHSDENVEGEFLQPEPGTQAEDEVKKLEMSDSNEFYASNIQ